MNESTKRAVAELRGHPIYAEGKARMRGRHYYWRIAAQRLCDHTEMSRAWPVLERHQISPYVLCHLVAESWQGAEREMLSPESQADEEAGIRAVIEASKRLKELLHASALPPNQIRPLEADIEIDGKPQLFSFGWRDVQPATAMASPGPCITLAEILDLAMESAELHLSGRELRAVPRRTNQTGETLAVFDSTTGEKVGALSKSAYARSFVVRLAYMLRNRCGEPLPIVVYHVTDAIFHEFIADMTPKDVAQIIAQAPKGYREVHPLFKADSVSTG